VCAFGVLIREPLLSDYEMLNVHPSLLPRWRGAAPVERAIMAGDARPACRSCGLTAGWTPARLPAGARADPPDDDYGTLAGGCRCSGGELLVRALDERPPFAEQDPEAATYARKIEARDRSLDFTQRPEAVERTVRALRPHIGARLPLPDGSWLGVISARVPDPAVPTLAPAGGRVRVDGDRLLLDCNGGALELVEVRPPGGRPMDAAAWLRGPPGRGADRVLARPAAVRSARWRSSSPARSRSGAHRPSGRPPRGARLARDAGGARRAARAAREPTRWRAASAAYVLGQLGGPTHASPREAAALLEAMAAEEHHPRCWRPSPAGSGTSASRTASSGCCGCTATRTPACATSWPTRWRRARTRGRSRR
jgi:methionyl-tRNA formyltransferase